MMPQLNRILKSLLLLALFSVTLLACRRIPLYDPQAGVYLKLDIQLNTNIHLNDDIDIEGDPELHDKVYGKFPELVRACFYDRETHELVFEDFLPPTGGFIEIPAGLYDLIVYSLGAESTIIGETELRGTAYAYTNSKEGQPATKDDNDGDVYSVLGQPVINEPDHVFVARKEGIVIPVHSQIEETIVIEGELNTLLESYSFEVRNVVGAGRIQKAEVFITGQMPSKKLWDLRYPSTPSTIWFPAVLNEEKGHIYTVFNTFGKLPGSFNKVLLNVQVTDVDGNRYQWIFDVTDQFDNPENIQHEIIIDESIVIPEEGSAGGFVPTVTDWDGEIVEIPLT